MQEEFISGEGMEQRTHRFLRCFHDMEEGCDIVMYGGHAMEAGQRLVAAVLIEMNDATFPFTTHELRVMADFAEDLPFDGFKNLASQLRQGADAAEAKFHSGSLQ